MVPTLFRLIYIFGTITWIYSGLITWIYSGHITWIYSGPSEIQMRQNHTTTNTGKCMHDMTPTGLEPSQTRGLTPGTTGLQVPSCPVF